MDDLVKEAGGAGKFQVMMTAALKVGGEQACDDHITFDESVKTVVNEWSLVCDLSYVKPLMTLQMVGVLLGAFLGGQASDTIGRRLTVYLTSLFHVVACVVAAFSVSWEMFMAMRVVIGVTLGVFLVASFSYPLEFVNPKWRQVSGAGNVTVPYFGDREQGDRSVLLVTSLVHILATGNKETGNKETGQCCWKRHCSIFWGQGTRRQVSPAGNVTVPYFGDREQGDRSVLLETSLFHIVATGNITYQVVAFLPGLGAGVSVFALMAWLVPDWSYLHIGSAVMGVPFLLTWFFVPESARWLAAKGRLEEAEAVVERVARVNGRPKPNDTLSRLRAVAEEERQAGQGRRYTYLDVYRGWRMAFTTLILNCVWFSLSFSYYGISFGVSGLSGNVYLNIFLMTIIDIPPNFSTVFLTNSRLGRRGTSLIFFILSLVSSFGILVANEFAPEDSRGDIATGLAMVSKLSVSAAWMAVVTLTSELYPTVIRNLGYGASNTMSRIGGALAPVLLNMDTTAEVVRGYIVVGFLMAASGLACLLLRETKGQGLQDTIATKRVKDEEKDQVKAGWPSQSDVTGSGNLPVWTVNGDKEKMAEFQNGSSNGFVSVRL
ncbi:hypothetical protein BaRGS_00032725 [Batillaria attramentaria]|uniref:Major facilitator superfamily (MFS) profile domain-containing protein n=1 Tax=Batillaria attramentaria TaxID=370345 RepID=A0ABD0JLV3_9CAEN